jgi:hypothetical protein
MIKKALLLLAAGFVSAFVFLVVFAVVAQQDFPWASDTRVAPRKNNAVPPPVVEASPEQVHEFCAHCHAYPPPDTFPRSAWRRELRQAYDFFRDSALQLEPPSLESVALYYENRAPERLPLVPKVSSSSRLPFRFEQTSYALPDEKLSPAVSNVNLVHLFDKRKLDVVVCDMVHDQVLVLQPYVQPARWQVLGRVSAPAHAEVVDLDGDGIPDVLVACLGSATPTNKLCGSVVWLRGLPDRTFAPYTLLDGVGRVADVQAADFNGDGKLDLVVAVFGWTTTGATLYLENRTTDWSRPVFETRVVDDRHGAIHVPVADLNHAGRPDFVALISQEHETIVAFLNDGRGHFRKETIYTAPHPAYGSSGIQLVDLNGDGKLDVLYTNGDVLDRPFLLKPYHSVQWLENRGSYPFVHHHLTALYGAMRAVAADFQGTGKPDIVAVSFLPADKFPEREGLQLDSMILLEQTSPGNFIRHSLETTHCDHFTCAAGALDGDGKVHLVTGNFDLRPAQAGTPSVTIWRNLGSADQRPRK